MPADDIDYCSECNAEVPSDAKKCPECGIEFEDDADLHEDSRPVVDEKKGIAEAEAEDEEDEEIKVEGEGEEEEALEEEDIDEEEEDLATEEEEGAEAEEEIRKAPNVLRGRILFYTGIILTIVGGPGLAFGSWLHDVLSVPIIGETYAAFGWINVMFAIAGGIILIIGILLLALSLRGGILTQDEFEKLKAEGLT